jgi:hypothetical protein
MRALTRDRPSGFDWTVDHRDVIVKVALDGTLLGVIGRSGRDLEQ